MSIFCGNYISIFRLIQYHTLSCEKKECPCKKLIPKNMSYSELTNFTIIKKEESQNNIEEKYNSNNINKNSNKELTKQNLYKKYTSNFIDDNNKPFRKSKGSGKNLMIYINEEKSIELNARKRSYSVRKNIQHSRQKTIINDTKEKKDSNIINENNIKVSSITICSNSLNKKELNTNIEKKLN